MSSMRAHVIAIR
jgi:hypothetical protein